MYSANLKIGISLVLTMRDSQQDNVQILQVVIFLSDLFFDITSQFENVLSETPPPPKSPNDVVGEKIDMFAAPNGK